MRDYDKFRDSVAKGYLGAGTENTVKKLAVRMAQAHGIVAAETVRAIDENLVAQEVIEALNIISVSAVRNLLKAVVLSPDQHKAMIEFAVKDYISGLIADQGDFEMAGEASTVPEVVN